MILTCNITECKFEGTIVSDKHGVYDCPECKNSVHIDHQNLVTVHTFKASGKWYATDTYTTKYEWENDVMRELRDRMKEGKIPGLRDGAKDYHVVFNIHKPGGYPSLLLNEDLL